jgi:GTP-binding protein
MSGIIAIVGRPNVGKSALFNRIAGRRIAIVHDQPGVTRDRVTAELEWQGMPFTLVDTGGIGLLRGEHTGDVITRAAVEQVQIAIDSAHVILMVVNVQEGIVPLDEEVAQRLRRCGKPVFVVVNKTDAEGAEAGAGEFSQLGFDRVFPVSAIHGRGIAPVMQAAMKLLPPQEPKAAEGKPLEVIRLAIVGRPNVGKSSIINAITQSERVIVSPIPGTTRDAVDVPFEVETDGVRQRYILIDTAGLRKARRVNDTVEFFSVKRTEDSITRCDIAVLVLDAESGILEQDKKVADRIVEAAKACIVVVNKWDLVEDTVRKAREEEISRRNTRHKAPAERDRHRMMSTLGEFGEWVQEKLFFLDYAPVIFTSAQSGFNLERLLEAVRYVAAQLKQTIPTALLNRTLHEAIERRQPISSSGQFLKFFYATQVQTVPPTFLLFVNRDELFSPAYKKYLADRMRQAFGYEGCPVLLVPKARPKTIDPVRTGKPRGQAPARGRSRPRSARKPGERPRSHRR